MRRVARSKPVVLFVWPAYAKHVGEHCHSEYGEQTLNEYMERVGLNVLDVEFVHTELIQQCVAQGRKPTRAQISTEAPNLHQRIERLDPALVLAVGAVAFKALTGMERIMEWVGREMQTERGLFTEKQWTVIPILHPDHVATYPMRGRELQTALKCAVDHLRRNTRDPAIPSSNGVVAKNFRRKHTKYSHYTHSESREAEQRLNSLEGLVAFDFETSSLDPFRERLPWIVVAGFCNEPGRAFTIELGKNVLSENHRIVRDWLLSDKNTKLAHNAKFEIKWSRRVLGVHPKKLYEDTMLMHHLIEEESSHKLEILALAFTALGGYDMAVKRLLNQGVHHHDMPMDVLAPYCAGDVDATIRLHAVLSDKMNADPDGKGLWRAYRESKIQTMHVLAVMEEHGMHVDPTVLEQVRGEIGLDYRAQMDTFQKSTAVKRARRILKIDPNVDFNVNSDDQSAVLLYDVLSLPREEHLTKTGGSSTGEEALKDFGKKHAVVRKLSALRTLRSDVRDLDEIRDHLRQDGYINSNYRLDVVVSGRLASREPNLQNERIGSPLRKIFRSRFEGGAIVSADYSQQEVRILASLSGERNFIDAFEQGIDPHNVTASRIFRVPIDQVDPDKQRYPAKRVTFGIVYGIGPGKLAREIGWSKRQAADLLDRFYQANPYIAVWQQVQQAYAHANGRVVNVYGLVRRVPDINDPDQKRQWAAERRAVNFLIQSVGAELTLRALRVVAAALKVRCMFSRLIGQIHDSLLLDVCPAEYDAVLELLEEVMVRQPNATLEWLKVPLKIDVSTGPDWYTQTKVKAASRIRETTVTAAR